MKNNYETIPCKKITDYAEFSANYDYGPQVCWNRFYISFVGDYQKEHTIHAAFINGYNSDKREMYADFWDGGR